MQQNHCNAASISLLHPARETLLIEKLQHEQMLQHRSKMEKMPELARQAKQIEHANLKYSLTKEADASSESRIQKRHYNPKEEFEREMRLEKLPWFNPCGGQFEELQNNNKIERESRFQVMKNLKFK